MTSRLRAAAAVLTVLALSCFASSLAGAKEGPLLKPFPDFGALRTPGDFVGRTFKLSQEYPQAKPPADPAVKTLLAINFKTDWRAYAETAETYAFEGNVHGGPVGDDFYLEDNPVRGWYHVPWQQWGPAGREGIHGLTAEATAAPFRLSPYQTHVWQAFAVGFYNAPGGWAIGRVWADPNDPRPERLAATGFPVGTVVAKVLFTDAPVAEAPFLTNPLEWTGYVFTTPYFVGVSPGPPPPRKLQTLRLIQMDVMVRDDRAKDTGGWVYLTYVYNGALNHKRLWDNLVPVGLSWGNDPTVTSMLAGNPAPTRTIINPDLRQTIINPDARELPPQHLGFGLRLSGPVDNNTSSCQSCHMTAEYPQISPIVAQAAIGPDGKPPACGSPTWMRWFKNRPIHTAFDPGAIDVDHSLQMSQSYTNFIAARAAATQGLWSVQYWKGQPAHSVVALRGGPDGPNGATCQ